MPMNGKTILVVCLTNAVDESACPVLSY